MEYEHTEVMYAIFTPYLQKSSTRPAIIFLCASRQSPSGDNRRLALKIKQLSYKMEGPETMNHHSEGNCSLNDGEFLLWILCKRQINFYFVWTIMFVWFGTMASIILTHINTIIIFMTYLWKIFHNEILNSLRRSRYVYIYIYVHTHIYTYIHTPLIHIHILYTYILYVLHFIYLQTMLYLYLSFCKIEISLVFH